MLHDVHLHHEVVVVEEEGYLETEREGEEDGEYPRYSSGVGRDEL